MPPIVALGFGSSPCFFMFILLCILACMDLLRSGLLLVMRYLINIISFA